MQRLSSQVEIWPALLELNHPVVGCHSLYLQDVGLGLQGQLRLTGQLWEAEKTDDKTVGETTLR